MRGAFPKTLWQKGTFMSSKKKAKDSSFSKSPTITKSKKKMMISRNKTNDLDVNKATSKRASGYNND